MLDYKATAGQSIWDVCLNTYGTFDLMAKLLVDNLIVNIDAIPQSGQVFIWDETLTADQAVNQISTNAKIIYATAPTVNGNVLSVVQSVSGSSTPPTQSVPVGSLSTQSYMTAETQYIATGGESAVTFTELVGANIIQITREVQPLKTSEFSFVSATGVVTLIGLPMVANETLYIIYQKAV